MAFVAREGHAAVPDYHVEDGFKLGTWTSELHGMRNFWKTLSEERIRLLESLEDWNWSWQEVFHSGNNPHPGSNLHPRETFLSMTSAERAAVAYDHLTLLGVMDDAEAIKSVALDASLARPVNGYRSFLADTEVLDAVRSAIEHATELGYLDRPRPDTRRAVMVSPDDWSIEDFCFGTHSALQDGPLTRSGILAGTLVWARESCGLVCDPPPDLGKARAVIKEAIDLELNRGHLEPAGRGRIESVL
jgi:hypothetical protein